MRRRGKQTEYQAAIKKFLEESKEPLKRLKLLKHGMGKFYKKNQQQNKPLRVQSRRGIFVCVGVFVEC